jgi:hypothetical protein
MKTLLVGECRDDHLFSLADPGEPTETQLEGLTVRALSCMYPHYHCFVFTGSFMHEGRIQQPDLALVARDFSHWFVIEVELVSHSLMGHVLPQVVTIRSGEPQSDCTTILARELSISPSQAQTLLSLVPRSVAVVANRKLTEWQVALGAVGIQLCGVNVFVSPTGEEAIEFDGALEMQHESIGFGQFSQTDQSVRLSHLVSLPDGPVQIADSDGVASEWTVRRDMLNAWVTKVRGAASLSHGSSVQLLRTYTGRITLRELTAHRAD